MSEPTLSTQPPPWAHCGDGAHPATDPVGCRAVVVPEYTQCLVHLSAPDRHSYLNCLQAGDSVDFRGTRFTPSILRDLLTALRDPNTGDPIIGKALFAEARFNGDATFSKTTFLGAADFSNASFSADADFSRARFKDDADFAQAAFNGATFHETIFDANLLFAGTVCQSLWMFGASFTGPADFCDATIKGLTHFGSSRFSGLALFDATKFQGPAWFTRCLFRSSTEFTGVTFHTEACFHESTFEAYAHFSDSSFKGSARFPGVEFKSGTLFDKCNFYGKQSIGPLLCRDTFDLSLATFHGPTVIEAAASTLSCIRTEWLSAGVIRLRHTRFDLTDAVLMQPSSVSAARKKFRYSASINEHSEGMLILDDSSIPWPEESVSAHSLQGIDAAMLTLIDVNLTICRFYGAIHLDQIRLEGRYPMSSAPSGIRRRGWLPVRSTPRRTLAEEQHWRAQRGVGSNGWASAQRGVQVLEPVALAPIYRQLRKALEDGKHEPGAADFYYGEMEMRRHADDIPWSERALLALYWLVSGYGLRASRALGWLTLAMMTTIVLMMGFGLPQSSPKQEATGTVPPGGGTVTFEIDKNDPRNPTEDRFTTKRFEKALNVTLNSVVFRSSGQDLTTAGGYVEMASRFSEPVFLGLAALAIRGRVKR